MLSPRGNTSTILSNSMVARRLSRCRSSVEEGMIAYGVRRVVRRMRSWVRSRIEIDPQLHTVVGRSIPEGFASGALEQRRFDTGQFTEYLTSQSLALADV